MIRAHSNSITALAFSPDGKFLVSYSCGENRLSFWQTSTGKKHLILIRIIYWTTFWLKFQFQSKKFKTIIVFFLGMFGLGQSQTRCIKGYSTAPIPDVTRLNPMRLAKLIWINNRTVTLMLADGSETRFNV